MRRFVRKCATSVASRLRGIPDPPIQLFVYSESRGSIPTRCREKAAEFILDGASRESATHLVLTMQEPDRNSYDGCNLNSGDYCHCGPDSERKLLVRRLVMINLARNIKLGILRGFASMVVMEPTTARRFGSKRAVLNLFCGTALLFTSTSHATLDPEPRQLLHLGVNQSLHNDGPQAHYLFYYWNKPDFPATNQVLRLVFAPTYLDGDYGLKGILGENTDLGLGVFGGGFAHSYDEVRRGNYFRDESFDGHGGGANVTLYHLFNPAGKVPLHGLVRASVAYRTFDGTDDTANNFVVPENQPFFTLRTGFRFGGAEPVLPPQLGMEISAWYELEHRTDDGRYGFSGDRQLESTAHRFFGRALLHYTAPKSEHYMVLGLMGGAVLHADRFSAFRVGGALPFTSEFPLYLPGYFYGE